MQTHPNVFPGIGLMMLAMAAFSVMNTLIRDLSFELPSMQIVFLRNILSLLVLVPWVLYHGAEGLKTNRLSRHFWRAFIGILAMECWFYGISLMPLNEATALSFTSPIFATVLAVICLGERLGVYRIAAVLCGFAGALIIIQPDMEAGMHVGAAVVLFATFMMAVAGIVVKTLTSTDPAWRIVTYMAVFMTLMSAPPAILVWQPLSPDQLLQGFGIAVFSTIAQLALTSALGRAPIVVLAPFDFTRLVFTALLAYMVLGETLGVTTVLGACIIVCSAVVIAWRENIKRKASRAEPL